MKKTKALQSKEDFDLSVLTPEQIRKLEENATTWLKELLSHPNAVLKWNQEFLILVEEILRKDHGFSEGDLVKLEKRIKEMLPRLHKMALEGLTNGNMNEYEK